MSYVSTKHPEHGTFGQEAMADHDYEKEFLSNGTRYVAAINADDKYLDPVNYWVGMWGKLIILAVIKRQADIQQIDLQTDIQKLDWESIRKEICRRVPHQLNGILGGTNCYDWFQNRLLAFEKRFPGYKRVEFVMEQLFRYYSHHLVVLEESGFTNNWYWEQWHGQPSSGVLFTNENEKQQNKLSLDPSECEYHKEACLEVSECKQNNNGNYSNDGTYDYEGGMKSGRFVKEVPDFAAIENNAKTSSRKPELTMKRTLPVDEIMCIVRYDFKRLKIDGAEKEKKKAQLLSVLWTFNFGCDLLYEMSQEVKNRAKLQGGTWSCEYTLDKIEEKILNFEITDFNVLISSVRCLVAIYVSLRNDRKLTPIVSQIMDTLRKSPVVN